MNAYLNVGKEEEVEEKESEVVMHILDMSGIGKISPSPRLHFLDCLNLPMAFPSGIMGEAWVIQNRT